MESTYMLFTTKAGKVNRIFGPYFTNEVEAYKERIARDPSKVSVVEENAFSCLHPEAYRKHINENWIDKAFTYFALIKDWAGSTYCVRESRGFYNTWFNIYETLTKENVRCIQINFAINCNQFHRAKVLVDLAEKLPGILIVEGLEFYKKGDQISTGSKAISKYLATNLVDHMNLN